MLLIAEFLAVQRLHAIEFRRIFSSVYEILGIIKPQEF